MDREGFRSTLAPRAKTLLLTSGVYRLGRRILPSRKLAILRYHAVCDPAAGYAAPGICVAPSSFERHVEYLASQYRVLPLPDAVDALRLGKSLPSNAVAITFDDGYADNLDAARVLAKHGVSGTFYITAGCLAGGLPFWPVELRGLIKSIHRSQIDIEVEGAKLTFPLASESDRAGAVSRLTKLFKGHTIPVREHMREQLRALADGADCPSAMLTWDELAEMHRMGMVIGSHTMTHPNLPNAGQADAEREIKQSKLTLEERLGAPVTMFSYPNGGADRYMTPEVARLVREAGFVAATTSRNAFADAKSDVFALERVQVKERLEDLVFALEVERFAFKPSPRPGEVD